MSRPRVLLSVYGNDNRCLLDALAGAAADGLALRGVAVPEPDASDDDLERMHALGVRGVRLNLVNAPVLSVDEALALVGRMRHRGWHLQLQARLDGEGERLLEQLAGRCTAPIVVDHLGRAGPGRIPRALIELVAGGRAWVKLSAPYRSSRVPGHPDLLAAWLPDAALRQRICVANPALLHGF